jgi:hypothetical protein
MKQEKIFFLSCYAKDKNFGKEYNDRISELPNDAWICLMDQDVLPLDPFFGSKVHELIKNRGYYDIIGCMTNRLRDEKQLHNGKFSEETDILKHKEIAALRWSKFAYKITSAQSIAGMFMIFHKSTWEKIKFKENSLRFDIIFCIDAAKKDFKIGIAQGLYVFHMYRLGSKDPYNDIKHLL